MEKNLKPHIVLCHGLNNSPHVMDDLCAFFEKQGFECDKMTLTGHGNSIETIEDDTWTQDIARHYRQLPESAPKFFCGFSLGCLSHHLSTQKNDLVWDYAWYISPALQIKPAASLLKIPGIFPKLKLPSFSPKKYRVHDYLPCNYYNVLLRMKSKVDMTQIEKTHIFMSPKDEVVSYRKSKKLCPDTVEFTSLKTGENGSKSYYHLIPPYDLLPDKDKATLENAIRKDLDQFTF